LARADGANSLLLNCRRGTILPPAARATELLGWATVARRTRKSANPHESAGESGLAR